MENYGEEIFMGFNMSLLSIDQAYLKIISNSSFKTFTRYMDCIKCPYVESNNITEIVDVKYPKSYQFVSDNGPLCEFGSNFGEFGIYQITINHTDCNLKVLKEPVNIYLSLLTAFLIFTLISLIIYSSVHVWHIYKKHQNVHINHEEKVKGKTRVKSLDTFRGITIILMIFANYGCGGYTILDHTIWNGLHLADVIFPWFMWIMGTCIPISIKSTFHRDLSQREVFSNILRRSCILFALGVFLSSGPYLKYLRFFGVLQRFGICYFIVASSFVLFNRKDDFQDTIGRYKDIFVIKYQWILAIVCLLIHSFFTFWFEIPNCGRGYLGPGGDHENRMYLNCTGGATGYIDRLILGNHVYRSAIITWLYNSQKFDPEGIFGCLTSIIQVIFGVQAGTTLIFYKNPQDRLIRWIPWGITIGFLGGILCGFSTNDGLIPINKQLWSISFVLVTSGMAFILLSACYYLIDERKFWNGKPFSFCGMNAIFLYVAHTAFYRNFPLMWYPESSKFNSHFIMLLQNLWTVGIYILISYFLYKKKIFLSI